jgi:hypothetical protein
MNSSIAIAILRKKNRGVTSDAKELEILSGNDDWRGLSFTWKPLTGSTRGE